MVLGLVEVMTGHSDQFCCYIVQNGLMMEHIDELCKMRSTSTVSNVSVCVYVHGVCVVCMCVRVYMRECM